MGDIAHSDKLDVHSLHFLSIVLQHHLSTMQTRALAMRNPNVTNSQLILCQASEDDTYNEHIAAQISQKIASGIHHAPVGECMKEKHEGHVGNAANRAATDQASI